ncbi:MAG: hypothetical protein HW419_2735 [Deltaproteobacteria bacterium]|nr:hypothetical protein [Deltaproteobacteria bacterium]
MVQELELLASRYQSVNYFATDHFMPSQIGANCSRSMTPFL